MNSYYAAALLVAAATSAGIAVAAWNRRTAQGAVGLMLFMLAEVVWAAAYAVRWMVADPAAQHFWLDATYLGAAPHTTLVVIFALQFTNRAHLFTRRNLSMLAFVPLVTLLLLFTDEWHGLFFGGLRPTGAILNGGPWFWFFIFYTFLQIFFLLALFIQAYLRASFLYRKQIRTVLFASFLPVVGVFIGLVGLSPFPNLDLTPFIFTISGIIYAYALFGLHMLDIAPIARHKLVDEMSDGVIVLDVNRRVVDVNPAAQRLLGISATLIGKPSVEPILAGLNLDQIIAPDHSPLTELRVSEDPARDIELRVSALLDDRQNLAGQLLILRDITERKLAETEKWNANVRLRTLSVAIEQSPVTTVITDLAGNIVFVNPKFSETTGYTAEEAIGQNPRILKSEHTTSTEYQGLWETILSGQNWKGIFQNRKKNGELYWETATISPVKDEQGVITHFLAVKEDITERKLAEEAILKNAAEISRINEQLEVAINNANNLAVQAVLAEEMIRESEVRYRAVFDTANDAIISADSSGNIVEWNAGAERIFGYSKAEVSGQSIAFLMPARHQAGHALGMARVLSGGAKHVIGKTVEMEGQRKDGSEFPLELSLSEWQVAEQKFFAAVIRDNTERKLLREKLEQQATTDELTGTFNRRHFHQLALSELKRAIRLKHSLAIVLIDIDHFKLINDTFGHGAGDQVLIAFTVVCQQNIREVDLFARFGGDEFVLLLPEASFEQAVIMADRVRVAIAAKPFDLEGVPFSISVSMGVANLTGEADTFEKILIRADLALYNAKETGRNKVVSYDPS